MTTEGKLGARIRKYREQLGLTREQLAVNAGLDAGFLEDIECDLVYPPIGTIIKLSRALGQRVGTFMDDQYRPDPVITRRGAVEEETASHRGAKGHYHYYPLGKGKTDRHMEPLFITIDEDEEKEMSSHEGEEFGYVLEGKINVHYGRNVYTVRKGDSFIFAANKKHKISSACAKVSTVLWISTPPSF